MPVSSSRGIRPVAAAGSDGRADGRPAACKRSPVHCRRRGRPRFAGAECDHNDIFFRRGRASLFAVDNELVTCVHVVRCVLNVKFNITIVCVQSCTAKVIWSIFSLMSALKIQHNNSINAPLQMSYKWQQFVSFSVFIFPYCTFYCCSLPYAE